MCSWRYETTKRNYKKSWSSDGNDIDKFPETTKRNYKAEEIRARGVSPEEIEPKVRNN